MTDIDFKNLPELLDTLVKCMNPEIGNMKDKQHKFVPYPLALKLRSMGYKEHCLYYYFPDPNFDVPTGTKFNLLLWSTTTFDRDSRNIEHYVDNGDFKLAVRAPMWDEVSEWLRKTYSIHVSVGSSTYDPLMKFGYTANVNTTTKSANYYFGVNSEQEYYFVWQQAINIALDLIPKTT